MKKPQADQVDQLLRQGLLSPPDDFTERVMSAIQRDSTTSPRALDRNAQTKLMNNNRVRAFTQWLALALATAIGLTQTIAFVFGLWTTSIAG